MIGDVARAVADLRDPRLWGVAAKAAAATLALLAAAFWLAGWALGVGGDFSLTLPWIGEATVGGGWTLGLWLVAATVGAALLMPAVAAIFVGFLLDDVVDAVEARNYPAAGPASPAPWLAQIGAAAKLLLLTVALNALGLVVWVVLPPLAPFTFVALNGWLIGREYLELVAMRRLPAEEARRMRRSRGGAAFVIGCVVAAIMAVPFAALFAPMLGVAAVTHLYHRARGAGGGVRRP